MCIGNRLLWRCKKCLGIVLMDTRYRTLCPMAVVLAGRCSYEAMRWTDRHLLAGSDVNPRESLKDPSCGVALLRWNEFYCIHCELVDQVLHPIELHAEAPELDSWEVQQQQGREAKNHRDLQQAQDQRWDGDSRDPSWLTSLSLWKVADDMEPALQGMPRWEFLVPVDQCGGYDGTDSTPCRFHISPHLRELFLGGNDGGRGASETHAVKGIDDDSNEADNEEGGAPLYP
jgi:hypothetical protein